MPSITSAASTGAGGPVAPNVALKSSELLRLPTPPPSAALLWPASGVAALPSPLASPAAAPLPNAALLLPYTCASCQRQIFDKVSCVFVVLQFVSVLVHLRTAMSRTRAYS